ncbi:HAD family hydrolase [uncultured Sphingomonas sp.]|uniref:HAD family hydrolase n=1 Tax=uncultured Sphingomonas sp. TaxID=158754 RepID=UPI0025FC9958|nr:HAD family hydrolase [uncultured Sphingomonas sp.]
MPIKAVLFDIDGTLVDSNDQHVIAWEEAFAGIGARFDRQVIHDQIGKGTDMLVPTLLPGMPEQEQEQLGEAHGAVFKSKFLNDIQPFPGASDLLQRVHAAGQQVVLASSASKAELDHYLDLLDVRKLVAATTSADDVENTKPAPDIFATALTKIAPLSPEQVMAVGDTPYDIEAARKCGIAAIGLRSGKFSDDALQGAGAVALYDDVAALLRDYDGSPLADR